MKVQNGNSIKVHYVGKLDDGTVFDSSEEHGNPLEFTVGSGQVIKGFEQAVVGMEVDEEKTVKIPPADAYGDHNPSLVKKVPKKHLPEGVEQR